MTLADAIRTGKPFRRRIDNPDPHWMIKRCTRWPDELIQRGADGHWYDWNPTVDDILADYWETCEEPT